MRYLRRTPYSDESRALDQTPHTTVAAATAAAAAVNETAAALGSHSSAKHVLRRGR